MDVVVAGGHGKIGLRLLRLLAGRGDRARGIVRNPDHAPDLEDAGAEPVVLDMEAADDLTGAVLGADAIVFAAGAGPGSGPERKRTVDYGAAAKLIEAARAEGVERFVIVSSMGAEDPRSAPEQMRPYQRAKADADAALRESGLAFTIVRPGGLTDDAGTGHVALAERLGRRGEVSRDDVAAVLAAALHAPNTVGRTFELLGGETPIDEALRAL